MRDSLRSTRLDRSPFQRCDDEVRHRATEQPCSDSIQGTQGLAAKPRARAHHLRCDELVSIRGTFRTHVAAAESSRFHANEHRRRLEASHQDGLRPLPEHRRRLPRRKTEYLVILARDLGYVEGGVADNLLAEIDEIARMRHILRTRVEGRGET